MGDLPYRISTAPGLLSSQKWSQHLEGRAVGVHLRSSTNWYPKTDGFLNMYLQAWTIKYDIILAWNYPKDHWTLKSGYFEDQNTPAIQVQNPSIGGSKVLRVC